MWVSLHFSLNGSLYTSAWLFYYPQRGEKARHAIFAARHLILAARHLIPRRRGVDFGKSQMHDYSSTSSYTTFFTRFLILPPAELYARVKSSSLRSMVAVRNFPL